MKPQSVLRLSPGEARRLALAAQGFDRPRPAGRVDARHLRGVIRRLGLIQIDYVNVLAPAQYQVPFSRLGPYDRTRLDQLVYGRREFIEQAAHEASIVPVESWPLLRHRMEGADRRARALAAFTEANADYVDQVRETVRARGPLAADQIEDPPNAPAKADWWGWTMARAALEANVARGALAVSGRREDFARLYDLTERIIPAGLVPQRPNDEEAQRALVRLAAGALGIAAGDDLADYYRLPIRQTRARIAELLETGKLREARIEGWQQPAYVPPAITIPRRIGASSLLSPFDPVVWYRPRALRLFGFDYRAEIWIPRSKRHWGYYVLPFLLGDRLVARVDLQADRTAQRLRVLSAHIEKSAAPSRIAPPLATELRAWATWLDLAGVSVERKGNLASRLAAAL